MTAVYIILKCHDPGIQYERAANVPPIFRDEGELMRREAQAFHADQTKITTETFRVPKHSDATTKVAQRCAIITDPQSLIFKEWARRDNYPLLCVEYPLPPFVPPGGGTERVARNRFVISVLPDSDLSLAALGARLDQEETTARDQLLRTKNINMVRVGTKRPGYDNADPRYDGRAPAHLHTIVDAPRSGSVLGRKAIVAVMCEVLS